MHKLSVLAATAALVLATAPPANATNYTIDSDSSCNVFADAVGDDTGGPYGGPVCYIDNGTVPASDNVSTNGWTIRPRTGTFTNNGTIYSVFYIGGTVINNGSITPAGGNQFFGQMTNSASGTMTVMNSGTVWSQGINEFSTFNNAGSIDILNGAVWHQYVGTMNNTGSIEVACGGEYIKEPEAVHTGNPVVELCVNPTISAQVTSDRPKSSFGWYRKPVTITYTCAPGAGQTLTVEGCPAPDVISAEGADITRTATVRQTNNGFKRVTTVVDVDLTDPQADILGVESGEEYVQPPTPTCFASDALSGLASTCAVKVAKTSTVGRFAYSATATDKAGNVTTVGGTYDIKAPTTKISYVNVSEDRGKAAFKFKGAGNVSKLECALAKGKAKPKYKKCKSPASYKGLAKGKYTFFVRAVGLGGPDATPAKETFRIS